MDKQDQQLSDAIDHFLTGIFVGMIITFFLCFVALRQY